MNKQNKNYTGWIIAGSILVLVLIVGSLIWWGYESTKPASEKNQTNKSCATPRIKGNISQSGEKIYHNPDDEYYSRTEIDEGSGERMFCTEDEAKEAGWRHSKV